GRFRRQAGALRKARRCFLAPTRPETPRKAFREPVDRGRQKGDLVRMPERRWTIVIVPSDNEGTRTFSVTDSFRKAALWTAGIAVGVVLTAAVYLFTPYVSPAARIAQAENERLRAQLELIDGKLAALTDTIAQLGVRDLQMRALVGLTPDSLS